MRNKTIFLLILSSFLLACSPNGQSSIASSSEEISSEESSEEVSSESTSEDIDLGDRLNPIDESMFHEQVYLHHVGNVFDAWELYRGKGVTLAVIDSGFDYEHQEFKYQNGKSKVSDKSAYISTSGNNTTTTVGKNHVGISNGDSHGTFCAGVAAAGVNGTGVVGIAPEAELLLIKVDKKPKSINEAFKYAADNGAKVITISIGSYSNYWGDLVDDGSDLTTVFNEGVNYAYDKGVTICSAAGNGGEMGKPTEYTYPGGTPKVIGCGGLAYNSSDYLWNGSSYNSSSSYQFVDIAAPGENLYNACNYGGKTYDGGWNGTSFSSPIVAGAACLYFEKYPERTNVDFERDLYNSAAQMSDEKHAGAGRLDIGKLLDLSNNNEKKTIKFEVASWWSSDNAKTSVYLWNSVTGSTKTNWPGTLMTLKDGYYETEVDIGTYDSIIFTRTSPNNEFWGAQTIDISLYSLKYCDVYSISSTTASWTSDGKLVNGRFI